MGLEVRAVPAAQAGEFVAACEVAFGTIADDEVIAHWSSLFDPDFGLAVYEDDRIVATAHANVVELTLPAWSRPPYPRVLVPGVTSVGVLPTHRRRGLLTKLMRRQLADFARRGFPLAILHASEAGIYGRFGYGLAHSAQQVTIERHRSTFRDATPTPGRMRLLSRDEAAKVLPGLHEQARLVRPGEISRLGAWWDWHFADVERERGGGGGRFYALHETRSGAADGFVSYRFYFEHRSGYLTPSKVGVEDLVGLSAPAYAALWRYVLDLDLMAEVTAAHRPVDELLRWLLADPRQLRTQAVTDHMWLRVIDIPVALAARGYGSEERMVMEIRSPGQSTPGRFVLETSASAGRCRRARKDERAELSLGLEELGAIYLGGTPLSALADAGRVRELRPGALARAGRAFASPVTPFCSIQF